MGFPNPKGVLNLANHNWYSASTPTITTLQQLRLTLTKAFALNIHYPMRKFHDHSFPTPPPSNPDPPYFGQQVGF